mgnify:CR=1 FL=1
MRLSTIDRKRFRVRKKLKSVSSDRYRLSVTRSLKNISAQIIDDVKEITICSSSTLDPDLKKDLKGSGTIEAAEKVGKDIAAKAKKIGFEKVVFDRGGYLYHGE